MLEEQPPLLTSGPSVQPPGMDILIHELMRLFLCRLSMLCLLQGLAVNLGPRKYSQSAHPCCPAGPVGAEVFLSVSPYVHCLSPPLPRDLEARAQNEFFRAFFRLPRKEKLHAVADCSLWTPFSRCHTAGRIFSSDSYICFASREDGCCNVVLPLREVDLVSHHAPLRRPLPFEPKCSRLFHVAQTKHARPGRLIKRRGLAHKRMVRCFVWAWIWSRLYEKWRHSGWRYHMVKQRAKARPLLFQQPTF